MDRRKYPDTITELIIPATELVILFETLYDVIVQLIIAGANYAAGRTGIFLEHLNSFDYLTINYVLKSGDTITESDSQHPSKVITMDNVYITSKMTGQGQSPQGLRSKPSRERYIWISKSSKESARINNHCNGPQRHSRLHKYHTSKAKIRPII